MLFRLRVTQSRYSTSPTPVLGPWPHLSTRLLSVVGPTPPGSHPPLRIPAESPRPGSLAGLCAGCQGRGLMRPGSPPPLPLTHRDFSPRPSCQPVLVPGRRMGVHLPELRGIPRTSREADVSILWDNENLQDARFRVGAGPSLPSPGRPVLRALRSTSRASSQAPPLKVSSLLYRSGTKAK